MSCKLIKPRLGELLDGALPDPLRQQAETHLRLCPDCRAEYQRLSRLAAAIASNPPANIPRHAMWTAIEQRLDSPADAPPVGQTAFAEPGPMTGAAGATPAPDAATRWPPRAADGRSKVILWRHWRPLASAAAVVLAVGLGWALMAGPWNQTAMAGQIDFRPLLAQADGDIQAGIRARLAAHGGQAVTREQANRLVAPRVHAPATLPGGLGLRSIYRLNLGGNHWSIAYRYAGKAGQLLLLQCPPIVKKNYGGQECLPCKIAGDRGHIARVGKRLRLAHFASPHVCICIVSTLDEHRDLPAALEAIRIDF